MQAVSCAWVLPPVPGQREPRTRRGAPSRALCHAGGSRVTPGWVMTRPQSGSHAGGRLNHLTTRRNAVLPQTYEITFTGQAGSTLRAEFDDCEVTVGPGTTTLRAELPDQAALSGLVLRITGLGLKVIDMHLVAPPPND